MRTIKIAAAVACGLIILLLALTFTVENPEIAQYEKTVEILMEREHLTSEQALEKHFPTLVAIRSKIDQLSELNRMIADKTRSPAPIITEEEVLQLKHCREKIRQLRKGITLELSQLITTYSVDQL